MFGAGRTFVTGLQDRFPGGGMDMPYNQVLNEDVWRLALGPVAKTSVLTVIEVSGSVI